MTLSARLWALWALILGFAIWLYVQDAPLQAIGFLSLAGLYVLVDRIDMWMSARSLAESA